MQPLEGTLLKYTKKKEWNVNYTTTRLLPAAVKVPAVGDTRFLTAPNFGVQHHLACSNMEISSITIYYP